MLVRIRCTPGADPLNPTGPSVLDKHPKKKEIKTCSNCIAKVFGVEYYNSCSCCILPILQEMGVEEVDTKVLSQYFQCIY